MNDDEVDKFNVLHQQLRDVAAASGKNVVEQLAAFGAALSILAITNGYSRAQVLAGIEGTYRITESKMKLAALLAKAGVTQ